MNEIYTPEFIKLAEKIQDMIEPEVGMWFVPTRKNKTYIKPYPILVSAVESHNPDWVLFRSPAYPDSVFDYKIHGILLPSLSWLVRKLCAEEMTDVEFEFVGSGWNIYYTSGVGLYFSIHLEPSPEMAALKALCRIKGIAVD